MRMLLPLMLAHAYVLWMTAQQAADLVARTLLPRIYPGGRSADHNSAATTDTTAELPRGRWARYKLRVVAEAALIAEARRVADGELRQARAAAARGQLEAAAAVAPATYAGERVRARALMRLGRKAEAMTAYAKAVGAWLPVVDAAGNPNPNPNPHQV